MTSSERFLATINHKQPDKVVVDFHGHDCSMMHVSCIAALREYYGLEKGPVKVANPYTMTGEIEEDLKQVIGIDVESVPPYYTAFGIISGRIDGYKEWRLFDGLELLVPKGFTVSEDGKGGWYIYPQGDMSAKPSGHMPAGGVYFDNIIRQEPFDDDSDFNVEDNLEEFEYITDEMLDYYKKAADLAIKTGRGVMGTFGGSALGDIAEIPGGGLEHPKGIRSIEEWYVSPLIRPDHVRAIFDKQTDTAIANFEKINMSIGDKLDAVFICGADFGTQRNTLLSVDTYRSVYMPYHKKVNDWIHKNTRWKTLKHSCGAIEPLIGSLIEAGFDCLNPVQCAANGMNPRALKEKYGKDIVFWGGGVDTQTVLPFGTPEQVRKQVLERCEIFSPGGGFVFNAIHVVQQGTPVQNIVAMIDAVHEFNGD